MEYRVSVSGLSLSQASPLAYSPIEVGWRFANGVRVRTALDLFFYEAMDTDPNNPGVSQLYSYSMQDWRTTLAYEVPLPLAVHPVVGLCLEMLWGSRQIAQPLPNAGNGLTSANGGIGPGGVLGLEYRGSPHWAVSTLARYSVPVGAGTNLVALDLGFHYLF